MSDLKQLNMSENKLVVGSIEVIGDVTGNGMKTIRRNIESLTNSVAQVAASYNNYWNALGDDAIITPEEKKTLKKEFNTITSTKAAIDELAKEKAVTGTSVYKAYVADYNRLYNYLHNTIKVFDDMYENTNIPDVEYFNKVYDDYYQMEMSIQSLINKGESGGSLRILSSLFETGADGEVAIYRNAFYVYNAEKAEWEATHIAGYLGALNKLPSGATEDDYFLAYSKNELDKNICDYNAALITDEKKVITANGYILQLKVMEIEAGYIYLYKNGLWTKIEDKNNWRYSVALNDLVEHGFTVSPNLQEAIKQESAEVVAKNNPHYMGKVISFSQIESPKVDDQWLDYENFIVYSYNGISWTPYELAIGSYFMWAALDETWEKIPSGIVEKGIVYKRSTNDTWIKCDPSDTKYFAENLGALGDIIESRNGAAGYFDYILVNKLIADQAFMDALSLRILTLRTNGAIQSEDYERTNQGVKIDAAGNADLTGNTHIGGNCIIEGNVHCADIDIGGNSKFRGEIHSGPMELTFDYPLPRVIDIQPNTTKIDEFIELVKNYCKIPESYTNYTTLYGDSNLEGRKITGFRYNWVETDHTWFISFLYENGTKYEGRGSVQKIGVSLYMCFTNNTGAFTFKFNNLPTYEPAESGSVWNDNGTLKVVP